MGSTLAPLKEEDGLMPHGQMVLPAGEFAWSEATLPSPSPTENTWTGYISTASSQGQLSPMSSNTDTMNYHMAAGAGFPSYAGQWQDGSASQRERGTNESRLGSDIGRSGAHSIPKIEPDDDTTVLDQVQTSPSITSTQPLKRPRGRPRKHPIAPPPSSGSKVTKGRSKTGCITCRKRKKKCDEAKPKCNNCEKNAVVCEGYHEKQVWKSGRERAEEAERHKAESLAPVLLQSIFDGVETDEDRVLWRHYVNHLSNVMTIEGDSRNAFKDILLHLANQHQGVMHSILSFSGAHLDLDTPYGRELLQENSWLSADIVKERAQYHRDEALQFICEDINSTVDKDSAEYQTLLSARYAQMLCFLLQTLVDGNTQGEHRLHLQGYKSLIVASPPEDPKLGAFITEVFQYYICADDLLWHPLCQQRRVASDDWDHATPIVAPRLFGIADGLFTQLSRISTVRNAIRANIEAGIEPAADHVVLSRAAEIDAVINNWQPQTSYEDSRGRIGMLYKQCLWLYLYRSVYPPNSSHTRPSTLGSLAMAGTSTMIAPMSQRRASIATSIISSPAPMTYCNGSHSTSRNPSRSSSMHETDGMGISDMSVSRGSSPVNPTSARGNQKISFSVNQSLDVLESFSPNDPAQTLLLIPCLLVGTSCFEAAQRKRIRVALGYVAEYTGVRSCDRVAQLLEEIWSRMDQGDLMAVWDWQATAVQMELDFLCK